VGLNEKRKLKEHQEKTVPERTAELAEICGTQIPYEIEWDSFADDLEALNFLDNISFHRINMAFRVICADSVGKEGVKEGLKKIKLKNVKAKPDMKISFDKGVLEMHCAYALRTDGMYSDNEIAQLVTRNL
jgi:hypothetical protein